MAEKISPQPWSVRVEDVHSGKSLAIVDANGGVVALVKNGSGRKAQNAAVLANAARYQAALEAILEAGRSSDEPRARYCAEIASKTLES